MLFVFLDGIAFLMLPHIHTCKNLSCLMPPLGGMICIRLLFRSNTDQVLVADERSMYLVK